MKAARIVLVSRRFWPLVGDAEDAIADLASGLRSQGAQTTVVTAQWHADWPLRTCLDFTPIYRLPLRTERPWAMVSYLLALRRWLRRHVDQFDMAIVACLRQEASTTVRALGKTRIPVILRAAADDCAWQDQSSLGLRCRRRCQQATALVAPDEMVKQTLADAGYALSRIHQIRDGTSPAAILSGSTRYDARLALAAINSDLTSAVDAPVVVCFQRLCRGGGLAGLIRAWQPIVLRWPAAKLWLIGDGPFRSDLHRLIRDLDLPHSVFMPGSFESPDDVLQAASLLVHPGRIRGIPRVFAAAAVVGLPILTHATRQLEADRTLERCTTQIATGDVGAWSREIIEALERPRDRAELKTQRKAILREHSMIGMVQDHMRLCEQSSRHL